MHSINRVKMSFQARADNVAFARVAVVCFASQRDDLTVDDIEDIKLVVSEAVSNAIIHGYSGDESQYVTVDCTLYDEGIEVVVEDKGKGMEDVEKAREPAFTTHPERMGMGMTLMEALMTRFEVTSRLGQGTKVTLFKAFNRQGSTGGGTDQT